MKPLVFLIVLTAFSGSAIADGVEESGELVEGSWALQFRVSGSFTLAAPPERGISLKHQVSPRFALRGGIQFDISGSDDVLSAMRPDTLLGPDKQSADGTNILVGLDLLYYPRPAAPAKLYLGLGPWVTLRDRERTTNRDDYVTTDQTDAYGLAFTCGVEWFFTDYFALHAEYGARLGFYSSVHEQTKHAEEGDYRNYRENDRWRFGDTGVFFGLNVYL